MLYYMVSLKTVGDCKVTSNAKLGSKPVAEKLGSSAVDNARIVFVEVPLPKEVVELAKARGVRLEELADAAKRLLVLEIIAMESRMSIRDAVEIGDEVAKKAWEKLEKKRA